MCVYVYVSTTRDRLRQNGIDIHGELNKRKIKTKTREEVEKNHFFLKVCDLVFIFFLVELERENQASEQKTFEKCKNAILCNLSKL